MFSPIFLTTTRANVFYWVLVFSSSALLMFSLSSEYGDVWEFKYLVVMVVASLLVSAILLCILFLDLSSSLIFLLASFPVIVWGSSVIIIELFDIYVPLFFVIWLCFIFRCFAACPDKLKLKPFEVKFWGLLLSWVIIKFLLFFVSDVNLWSVFVTNYLSPLLFVVTLLLVRLNLDRCVWESTLLKGFKYLVAVVCGIMFLEMIIRSGGHPESFLLHGARRLYAHTPGDITGGLGEPVTMGLWAGAFSYIAYILMKQGVLQSYVFYVLLFISFFSMSRSSMLISIAVLLPVYFQMRGRKKLLMSILIVFFSVLFAPQLIDRISGSGDVVTQSVSVAGSSMKMELNMARYVFEATTWMDGVKEGVPWYVQLAALPLIGGKKGLEVLHVSSVFMALLYGLSLLSLFVFILFFVRKNNISVLGVLAVFAMVYYYGAFSSTAYSFYYELTEPIRLGYVPREAPQYLFILWLVYVVAFASDRVIPQKNG